LPSALLWVRADRTLLGVFDRRFIWRLGLDPAAEVAGNVPDAGLAVKSGSMPFSAAD
jgi:hypothetical protein